MSVVLALAGSLFLPLCGTAQTRPAAPRKPGPYAIPTAPEPEAQARPTPPLTPEQMPPVAPEVTYRNGQLTIVAQNSSLRDILSAVRARTGATLEVPPGSAGERVVVRLGPGAPRDVLAALFQGSSFDYILLGSADNPGSVQRIILTLRGAPAGAAGSGTAVLGGNSPAIMPAPATPRPFVRVMPAEQTEETEGDAPPESPQPPPNQLLEQQAQPPTPQPPPGPGQPQVKTPEQLLQELQRMQQEQQRQQRPNRSPEQ